MGKIDNRRPATPEQIESMKTNFKLTVESSYHELYVDMVLLEALKQGMMDTMDNLDKEYVSKVLRVHANVCYANLCLCVQLRASLKAELGVEKQYNIRRSLVTAHEMYKYLYGFNGKHTLWLDIEPTLRLQYPEKCVEIADSADLYLKEYAQNKDCDTRNVAKHFSDNPEEFYERMSPVNERSVTDRIVALMRFMQPIHSVLVEELRNKLGLSYLVLWTMHMPKQRFEVVGSVDGEKLEAFKQGLVHYEGIVNGLFRQIGAVKKYAGELNWDLTQIPEWQFLVDNNMVAHVLYIYLDLTSTFLAFTRSETFAEYQQNLAYMFLSAHEGFKKLYGFSEDARDKSYWNRAVKAELAKLGGETLADEVDAIEERLVTLSQSDYLKDDEMAAVFSDIKTNKKAGKENAILVLNYFLRPVKRENIKDLEDFLFVMNDIVRLVNKILALESAESSRRVHETFDHFRQMFDKIDAAIAENVKDAEQAEGFNETTRKFRELIDSLEGKALGKAGITSDES